MKPLFVTAAVLSMTTIASAAETKPYVSSTFQNILGRVVKREPESKAILSIKAKPDTPFGGTLGFEIKQIKENQNQVSITLFRLWMNGREVCESYLLRPESLSS